MQRFITKKDLNRILKEKRIIVIDENDNNYGKLDSDYPDCEIYVKDIGPLPIEEQKKWFTLWSNVIKNRFIEWYNEYTNSDPVFDYDKDTGFITVWDNNQKEFFQTQICGYQETRVPKKGFNTTFKQSYEIYNDNNKYPKFPGKKAVKFIYRGEKF